MYEASLKGRPAIDDFVELLVHDSNSVVILIHTWMITNIMFYHIRKVTNSAKSFKFAKQGQLCQSITAKAVS